MGEVMYPGFLSKQSERRKGSLSNSFHFWKTYSGPNTVLRAFYAFSHVHPPTRLWNYFQFPGAGTEI